MKRLKLSIKDFEKNFENQVEAPIFASNDAALDRAEIEPVELLIDAARQRWFHYDMKIP